MIVARIRGGLGNQLFQYAAARRLADHLDTDLELDLSWFSKPREDTPRALMLDQLTVRGSFRSSARGVAAAVRRLQRRTFVEQHFRFDSQVLSLPDGTLLDGYFQSAKYFEDSQAQIRNDLRPRHPPSRIAESFAEQIRAAPAAVSLHVRRGDYVERTDAASVLGALDLEYYRRALEALPQRRRTVFIFSDDLAWCEENMLLDEEVVFVGGTASPVEDLLLMATCRDNVIANSTLSWWAGWLNAATDKTVVAPALWSVDRTLDTTDLVPVDWVRV